MRRDAKPAGAMPATVRKLRCAVYTRKSSEEGLDMEFNSLDAQREACEAYIASQRHEGWKALPKHYDDGGYSGGNTQRPALQALMADIVSGKVDIAGDEFGAGQLLVFKPGDRISILAIDQARVMIVGGEPMDGPRNIWWNFVSSSKERIEQAKHEWKTGRFDTVPGDESEFIPLPES